MEIINVSQCSPKWFELRAKRMTASHGTAIGNCGKGLETYIDGLMQDFYSSKEKEHFSNHHTDRGSDLEDSAAFLYEVETGIKTEKVGFVIHSEYIGCSPDVFAKDKTGDGLAEIKAPDDKEFFRRLMGGKIAPGHIWQMNMQMLICELDWCDHVDYNPNYKKNLIIERVYKDQGIFDSLESGFRKGEELIKAIEKKMSIINAIN